MYLGETWYFPGVGIRVAAWTFDEFYGRDGGFLDGLDALGQTYVAEVPVDFTGWVRATPRVASPDGLGD